MSGKNVSVLRVLVGCTAAAMTASAWAQGKVVAVGDEWMVSDSAFFADPVNTTAFTLNVANLMTGGGPGNFLIYTNNFGLTGSSFASTLAGHTLTYNASLPLTLANLSGFDGVFLAGSNGSGAANAAVLAAYVNNGGSVFVEGGTGEFGPNPANEAAGWNPFLNQFGLAFGSQWVGPNGIYNVPLNAGTHALHAGMNGIVWSVGQEVIDLDGVPANAHTVALYGDFTALGESNNLGIVGVYCVPAPTAASALGLGVLFVTRRRRA
ncbi:MAG: hypothetical protein JNM07_02630 [Phycisphaerae bacterium]|nr:hypothetical protein [Phycisphaerae bacterium]